MDYSDMPDWLRSKVGEISLDPSLHGGMQAMRQRFWDMPGDDMLERQMAADLVGIALVPEARAQLEQAMDDRWEQNRIKNVGMGSRRHGEIVFGAGYHAAVYCAVRARMGKPKPLVIDQMDTAGGESFAMTREPSFFANSRNRGGGLNAPGEGDGLNVIPGAVVQPSMVSIDEYQTNADIAFAIRLTLAMHAKVALGKRVTGAGLVNKAVRRDAKGQYVFPVSVTVADDRAGRGGINLTANRVIDARGLGNERKQGDGWDRVMTFSQFMRHMVNHRSRSEVSSGWL